MKNLAQYITESFEVNESLKYNWKEFTGKKLPEAAKQLLQENDCGEYLRTWQKAYYHDDENNYKNWIIAGNAPGIKVGCKFTLFFHMSARQPHFPDHKFSDTWGCECYRTKESMMLALDGYLTGIQYKGF